jgi:phosphinothricin acetyltransferase
VQKEERAVEYSIRPVNDDDWQAVSDVFNGVVDSSMAAYPEEHVGLEFFAIRHGSAPEYPFVVVEAADRVVGFAYLSPFHTVRTMRRSAQVTYFIMAEHTGKGLGSRLLDLLLNRGREMGVDNFLAHISSLNEGSIRFHTRYGFTECGRFRRVGTKHGRDFDMVWMQRLE